MKTIEITGKNVQEALSNALVQLNLTEDKVDVEILDEGSKGIFNLIGTKPAKIKVTQKFNIIDEVNTFLNDVISAMGVQADINTVEEADSINIQLSGEKMGLIIGYRGETLDSLQYLVSLVANKDHEKPYKKVVLDAENYRKKRYETLTKVAQKTAEKVKKTGRPYRLEPMNPYERRIIHSTLQEYAQINTYSEGDEPFRRIVVSLKR